MNAYWARSYRRFEPASDPQGHWGKGQTGFNIAEDGTINLSANRKMKTRAGGWVYPTHRELVVAARRGLWTVHSGIYSWGYSEGPTLWLYPVTQTAVLVHPEMCRGLASLIGVHRITGDTPVRSNTHRQVLFRLQDVSPE